ncbi:MAG: carbamate kinase [Aquabacterium sp.]
MAASSHLSTGRRLVVALGGHALLRREQAPTARNQLDNIRRAAAQLARVAATHDIVLTHGNGPQIGLLALQPMAAAGEAPWSLDVLGAQTDGMIGYLFEQEIANRLPAGRVVATLLTRIEVDPRDPAFDKPSKPIGPVYPRDEGARIGAERGWAMVPDSFGLRRAVASPRPLRVLGVEPIRWLLDQGALVIAAGGGGIPVARRAGGVGMQGVDAVIDKDLSSGMLAADLQADMLVIATDVDAVFVDWGGPAARALRRVTPEELERQTYAAGSMGPKVEAACRFVRATGGKAVIGSLDQIEAMLAGDAGTLVLDRP